MIGLGVLLALVVPLASPDAPPAWPSIDDEVPAVGGGERDAAVIIGIDDYTYLPAVPGAAQNATAWQQWLLRVRKTPTQRVVTLRDSDATRERILRGLKSARDSVAKGGSLWVVFIGHGAPAPAQGDGLVLGVDTQPDADSLMARGILQGDIAAAVAGGAQAETIIVFDACFSGRTSDGGAPLVEGLQATLPVRARATSKATVLASSDTFAGPLPGVKRPAFSYLLLGSLRGWGDDDGDGVVTVEDAVAFTTSTMQAALRSDARLPSQRGIPSRLALRVSDRAFDVGPIVTGRCPAATRWNGRACLARCPPSSAWSGSGCVSQVVSCPVGMSWTGTSCTPTIECPPNTAFNAGACVASVISCPEGSSWDGATCRATMVALVATAPPSGPSESPRQAIEPSPDDTPRPRPEPDAGTAPGQASLNPFPWVAVTGGGAGLLVGITGVVVSSYFLSDASTVLGSATTTREAKDAAVTTQYISGGGLAAAGLLGVVAATTIVLAVIDPVESTPSSSSSPSSP